MRGGDVVCVPEPRNTGLGRVEHRRGVLDRRKSRVVWASAGPETKQGARQAPRSMTL
jgi:hypothetical protein